MDYMGALYSSKAILLERFINPNSMDIIKRKGDLYAIMQNM
jgi:hypothetical protein